MSKYTGQDTLDHGNENGEKKRKRERVDKKEDSANASMAWTNFLISLL